MRLLFLFSALLLAFSGCDDDGGTPTAPPAELTDVASLVQAEARLTVLADAVRRASLADTLAEPGPWTLLAPVDGAFAEMDLDALSDDALHAVLTRHVVAGALSISEIADRATVTALDGSELSVEITADGLIVGGAPIQESGLEATNGVVHLLGAVIAAPAVVEPPLPTFAERLAEHPELGTLTELLATSGMDAALADAEALTVFAPTDDAFATLPLGLLAELEADPSRLALALQAHVATGRLDAAALAALDAVTPLAGDPLAVDATDGLRIGGAAIVEADIAATNGVLHIIDAPLIRPPEPPAPGTIAEVLAGDPRFATALVALQASAAFAAQLADPEADLTVFAPTEAAFADLEPGTLEALFADPVALDAVLGLHVIEGPLDATTLAGLQTIDTVGGAVLVEATDDGVRVGGALVIEGDIPAANGRVHAINAVLQPAPLTDLRGTLAADGRFGTLLAALDAARLELPAQATVFAPTDAAFEALPPGTLDALLAPEGRDALRARLLHHMANGALTAADLSTRSLIRAAGGQRLRVRTDEGGALHVDAATVLDRDLAVDEGLIHVIDQVLTPPPATSAWLAADGRFTQFLALAAQAELSDALDAPEVTVLAPTDAALADLPALEPDALIRLIQFHIIEGDLPLADALDQGTAATTAEAHLFFTTADDGAALANGVALRSADHPTFDGLVHVLDGALQPPAHLADVVAQAGDFQTLLGLIGASPEIGALLEAPDANLAVLAPTDAAFDALPEGVLASLQADPALRSAALRGHLLPGAPGTAALLAVETIPTLDGVDLPVELRPEGLFIGGAHVVLADLPAPNGVVHVVDVVRLPAAP